MEKNETFTLSAFPPEYEPALDLIGSKSGRRWNKIKESGLMPIESSIVASPGFDEAELIIECRKIYYNDLIPENFLDEEVQSLYTNDYHRLYFGEIVAISGIKKYIKAPEEIKKA
jgi:flavin reductase (DIM6/NTAB) family NADH-FMN oxidoreductase RutF